MSYVSPSINNNIYYVNSYDKTLSFSTKLYLKSDTNYIYIKDIKEGEEIPKEYDQDLLYASLYLDGYLYKNYLKIKVESKLSSTLYTLRYTSNVPTFQIATPFLERCSFFMPKWSSAYKNSLSNYSRLTYPLYNNLVKNFYKTSKVLSNSIRDKDTVRKYIELPSSFQKSVTVVKDKDNNIYQLTDIIENSPVSDTSLSTSKIKTTHLFKTSYLNLHNRVLKRDCSKLYIKSVRGASIVVHGITVEGTLVNEELVFYTQGIKTTMYKYKRILSISATDKNTVVSNYLDTKEDYSYEDFEKISCHIDKEKNNNFPVLIKTNNRFSLNFEYDTTILNEAISYKTNVQIKNLYVDNDCNVFILSEDNEFFTSILSQSFVPDLKLSDNNNNNPYIFIDTAEKDEDGVVFSIFTKELSSELKDNNVYIELEDDSGTYYLNNEQEITEEFSYINISNFEHISLKVGIKESSYISARLVTNLGTFQASFVENFLKLVKREDNVSDFIVVDDTLVLTKDDINYTVNIFKRYYEREGNIMILEEEKDFTIENTRGTIIHV